MHMSLTCKFNLIISVSTKYPVKMELNSKARSKRRSTHVPNLIDEGLPGGVLVPLFPSKIALCSHVPTLSECFRSVIFRISFPCSQTLANVPLFPSIFCQFLVPQNPWETLIDELSTAEERRLNQFGSSG